MAVVSLAERLELAAELLLQEWKRVVKDVNGSKDILRYFHEGLGWTWIREYINDAAHAWCGAADAYALGRAGLKLEIRREHCAGVTRMLDFARGTPRLLPAKEARRGDTLLMGPPDGPRHIEFCLGAPNAKGLVPTVGGNTTGELGDGTRGEGVGKHMRSVLPVGYHIHHVIRWLEEDFEPA